MWSQRLDAHSLLNAPHQRGVFIHAKPINGSAVTGAFCRVFVSTLAQVTTTLPTFPVWFYIPAALLAVLGLIGLYCSLIKGRAKGRPRCPKCWYDMRHAALPARCPECGTTSTTAKDLLRTRRHWLAALVSVLLVVPLAVVFARLHASSVYYAVMPRWRLDHQLSHNGTTIKGYEVRDPRAPRSSRIVVASNGRTLVDREDYSASIQGFNFAHESLTDLDNDGVKEAVVEFYSGGAHCCYRVFIIELRADGATIVADIDSQQGVAVRTPAVAGGQPTIAIGDSSFNYWKTSYADSPKPPVIYRLERGALRVALDLMDAVVTPQTADDFANTTVVDAFKPGASGPSSLLWGTMLDLLFAGHESEAWAFFDRTWGERPGKAEFRAEFQSVLAGDTFYQDVLAARAARAAGQPIPPSIVGMSGKAGEDAK